MSPIINVDFRTPASTKNASIVQKNLSIFSENLLHLPSVWRKPTGPIALPMAIGRLEHLTHNQRVLGSKGLLKMPFVYILYSSSKDSFYIGATNGAVIERLAEHLAGRYDNAYTAFTKDWEIFLEIPCTTISIGLKVEKHIKRMKSKKYILNLKTYPNVVERLLSKYGA